MDAEKEILSAFNPRDPLYRGKLWVRVVTPDTIFYHVYWRRIAVALGLLAIIAWLGLAAAAWGFVKYRRGYAEVRYLDLAFYPIRREHYRTGMGHYYIRIGRMAFERQDYREGYSYLQAGLARVPDDIPARRYIAIAEVRFGRPDRALRTLSEGLPYARNDFPYVKLLFGLLQETQEDEKTIALAQEYLPAQPDQTLLNQYVALQAATAHYHRGRIESAERLVADWKLEKSLEGQILLARCDWDRGGRELALQRLESQVERFPKRDELYLELVRLHREAGHPAEARRFALLRQFNDPTSPGPRIDLLHGYHAAGDTSRENREIEEYVTTFGGDASALVLLAWFAVETRQPALADRVAALAASRKFSEHVFTLARVQLKVASRDYRGASELAEAALQADLSGHEYTATLLGALRAIALFGLGENARAHSMLDAFLDKSRIRASDALLLARNLKDMDQLSRARRVLARAVEADPLNQPVLAELIRLDAASGDRAAVAQNLPALLALRKHSRAALEDVLRLLNEPGDATLRAEIRAALAKPVTSAP